MPSLTSILCLISLHPAGYLFVPKPPSVHWSLNSPTASDANSKRGSRSEWTSKSRPNCCRCCCWRSKLFEKIYPNIFFIPVSLNLKSLGSKKWIFSIASLETDLASLPTWHETKNTIRWLFSVAVRVWPQLLRRYEASLSSDLISPLEMAQLLPRKGCDIFPLLGVYSTHRFFLVNCYPTARAFFLPTGCFWWT